MAGWVDDLIALGVLVGIFLVVRLGLAWSHRRQQRQAWERGQWRPNRRKGDV